MSASQDDREDQYAAARREAREQQARRRRLAEVFGDVLPDQTRDDAGDPQERPAGRGGADVGEEWLRQQVPPHHGSV